jgi:hypothetical protein
VSRKDREDRCAQLTFSPSSQAFGEPALLSARSLNAQLSSSIHSAIAKEVFGLEQTVLWNHGSSSLAFLSASSRTLGSRLSLLHPDLFDWCLLDDGTKSCTGMGPADDAALDAEINAVLSGPKSPGVVNPARRCFRSEANRPTTLQLLLQHERTSRSISGFTRNYPNLLANGWDAR